MPFRDLVTSAKAGTPKNAPPTTEGTLVDETDKILGSGKSKDVVIPQKKTGSFIDADSGDYAPRARVFSTPRNADPKHGSIIRGIAAASDRNAQASDGDIPWQECGYRKETPGERDYCTEYHCFCYKDKCRVKKIRKSQA